MNALTNIEPLSSFCWEKVYADVNAWRGECIHHFSLVEMAVTETLLALNSAKRDSATPKLRHLIGQQYEDLASAIASDSPFGKDGKTLDPILSHYRDNHEKFRSNLCHGTIKVAVGSNEEWLIVLRSLSIRSRQPMRSEMILEQREAKAKLAALKRDGQKLSSALRQLRKAIA